MSASISSSFDGSKDAISMQLIHKEAFGLNTGRVRIDEALSIGNRTFGLAGFFEFSMATDLSRSDRRLPHLSQRVL
jgi:hypothetical protein